MMSHILSAAPRGAEGHAVRTVTSAVGRVLGLTGIEFTGPQNVEWFLAGMRDPDAMVGVVPRAGAGYAGWSDLVLDATRPMIVVPDIVRDPSPAITRVLVPLDGTTEAATAVTETLQLCAKAGLDLVVLHVFDPSTVPRHWDQAAHARQVWEEEFLARYCAVPGARLHLCSGTVGDQIVDVAKAEQVDLIALGWSRTLEPGRAPTVHRAVADADVPVMLLPVGLT